MRHYPLLSTDKTPDQRYSIDLEWCGHPEQRQVIRFCGDWIGQALKVNDAVDMAFKHDTDRMGVARPRDLVSYSEASQ